MRSSRLSRRLTPLLLVLGAALLVLPAAADAFALRTVTTTLEAPVLLTGPDRAMWFTEHGSIGRVSPAGRVERIRTWEPTEGTPGVMVSARGSMWVLDTGARWVARVTPSGTVTTFPTGATLEAGVTPNAIAYGPDDALWFAFGSSVARMTTDGNLSTFPTNASYNTLVGPARGPDGRVWFVEGDAALAVAAGGAMTRYPLTPNLFGRAIAPGHDGRMWIAGFSGVQSISTTGRTGVLQLDRGLGSVIGRPPIVAGPNGHIWLSLYDRGLLAEVSKTGRVTYHGPGRPAVETPDDYLPQTLAVGPGRDLWVAGGGIRRVVLRPSCAVPNVVGLTQSEARRRLRAGGCTIRVVLGGGRPSGPYRVTAQRSRAGAVLRRGATVTVTLRRPVPACRFPEGTRLLADTRELKVGQRIVRSTSGAFAVRTRTTWACMTHDMVVRTIDETTDEPYAFETELSRFTLAGTRIAFVTTTTSHYGDRSFRIVSKALTNAEPPTVAHTEQSYAWVDEPHRTVLDYAVDEIGSIAWIMDAPGKPATLSVQPVTGTPRTLDEGPSGTINDLRIDGPTVSWRSNRVRRTAPVAAPLP